MLRFLFRIACIAFLLLGAFPATAPAQTDFGGMDYRRLTSDEASELLATFRNYRLPGDVCLRFTITHVPRKSDSEVVYNGVLWGSWQNQGQIYRVELTRANGTDANAGAVGGAPLRLILQSGPAPAIWVLDASGKPVRATGGETQPLFPELIFTPFELQTPFNFWPDARYVETRRVRGRPTHLFQLTPPEDFKRAHPEVGFIKIGIDKAYRAPLQTIIYDAKGKESRKLEAESFARVQQRYYIPEEIRLLDLVSRDKDIFRVKAAALNLRFERNIFDPATLDKAAAQPEEARFEKVE